MSLGKEIISARGDHRGQELEGLRDALEEEQRKTMAAERAKRMLKSKAGEAGEAGDALRSAQSLLEAALAGRSAAEEKVAGCGAGGQGGRRGPGKGQEGRGSGWRVVARGSAVRAGGAGWQHRDGGAVEAWVEATAVGRELWGESCGTRSTR